MPSRRRSIALSVVLLLGLLAPPVTPQPPEVEELLARVAAEKGLALGGLRIADQVTINLPLTGVRLRAVKVFDTATGEAYLAAQDAAGRPADVDAATAAEDRARRAAYGKLDARLHARLQTAPPNAAIPVSIWLNAPHPTVSRPLSAPATGEEAAAALSAMLQSVESQVAGHRQGVAQALSRMGVSVHVPRYAPAVFVALTRGQIRAIARHAGVDTIYGPEEYTRFADDAGTTHRAHRVWAAGNLGVGMSSRPVVHEDDGIADFNPFLNNLTHPVVYYCSDVSTACSVGKNIGDHASEVAGVIASTHPLYRGIAPSAQLLLSANFQSFDNPGFDQRAVDAFEWARGNGGDPTNMSWGTFCGGFQTFWSRYADWAVRNLAATFTVSAGNAGFAATCGGTVNDEKVSAPGLAWSVITVGSHADDNTGFWTGDSMSAFSRWRNPDFATGLEKPEVTAVGQDVRTTDAAGGDHLTVAGVNGTSFSAPMVAGQVVQMLSRRPGQNTWPETNKAAVVASAFHDIEPGTTRDGLGSVVMNNSDDTYRLNRFLNDCHSPGCTALVAADFPRVFTDVMSLTAGQRVRVAIAWDSNSSGGAGTDVLGADIDLLVIHPDNTTVVCASASVQNAWEACEFTAPVTGTYDIRVNLFSSDTGWPGTFLGVAWALRSLPNFCSGYTTVPATGGTFTVNTAKGSTFFDSYPGWGRDQSGRERVLRLATTATRNITVTDANGGLDLHIMQISSCAGNPIVPTMRASGIDSASVTAAPAGVYWIVVDGFAGAVGTTSVNVSVTTP